LAAAARLLLDGHRDRALATAAALLPAPASTFTLQADLTCVAAGALDAPVATELGLLADVESTGAATVYRFSEPSLRRAFDAGPADPAAIVRALRAAPRLPRSTRSSPSSPRQATRTHTLAAMNAATLEQAIEDDLVVAVGFEGTHGYEEYEGMVDEIDDGVVW